MIIKIRHFSFSGGEESEDGVPIWKFINREPLLIIYDELASNLTITIKILVIK